MMEPQYDQPPQQPPQHPQADDEYVPLSTTTTTHTETTTDGYRPAISARVRTIVYIVGLTVGFLSILTIGLGAIFWPDDATQITAATGVIGTAVGWLASALGVAYRPTAGYRHQLTGRHAAPL